MPPLLAILADQTLLLRSCAHWARRLVLALLNTRSFWVVLPSSWRTVWRPAALAHACRARRPWLSVWARLSRRVARWAPITRGRSISRRAAVSASPIRAAKREEGMMGSIGLGRGVVEVCPPRLCLSYQIGGGWRGSKPEENLKNSGGGLGAPPGGVRPR